jgi:hypothetical protein
MPRPRDYVAIFFVGWVQVLGPISVIKARKLAKCH